MLLFEEVEGRRVRFRSPRMMTEACIMLFPPRMMFWVP